MVALSFVACAVTIVFLDANYAGIIEEENEGILKDDFEVLHL